MLFTKVRTLCEASTELRTAHRQGIDAQRPGCIPRRHGRCYRPRLSAHCTTGDTRRDRTCSTFSATTVMQQAHSHTQLTPHSKDALSARATRKCTRFAAKPAFNHLVHLYALTLARGSQRTRFKCSGRGTTPSHPQACSVRVSPIDGRICTLRSICRSSCSRVTRSSLHAPHVSGS